MLAQKLLEAAGNATQPNYIEDVFSTYLWNTSTSDQTINNGIDMTKGALTWIKSRSYAFDHVLQTGAGTGAAGKGLATNSTGAAFNGSYRLSDTTSGFTMGTDYYSAGNPNAPCVVWTFRKQPKFFDVVTWTGDGTGTRNIAHSLTSTPGAIFIKQTSSNTTWINWYVYHRANTGTPETAALFLNTTDSTAQPNSYLASTAPTSTQFTVTSGLNESTKTYVAYLFAHNAGGFGLTGTDNVISCGSFSGNTTVTLGWEPQWVLMKAYDVSDSWYILDNMRGWTNNGSNGNDAYLNPNSSGAETAGASMGYPTATGFTTYGFGGANAIYIAIRRGPMKVPTSGTSVFAPTTYTGNGTTNTVTTGFVTDLVLGGRRNQFDEGTFDRLRGASKCLVTSSTAAEAGTIYDLNRFDIQNGFGLTSNSNASLNTSGQAEIAWNFQRAPSFFDEVCFTGNSTLANRTYTHNLGVQPQLIIIKARSGTYGTGNWFTATNQGAASGGSIDTTKNHTGFELNSTAAVNFGTSQNWSDVCSTTTFTTNGAASYITDSSGNTAQWADSGTTYVAYLFASCPGVSKVGSYTGNGSTQTINCGFTGGARFVLIKRTDSTGDWYVWDTARGIVSGNDPHLSLNTTAAEVTTDDTIDPDNTGFIVNQLSATNVNVSAATYIYLAIA